MYILTALHSFQSLTTFEILSDLHWNAFSPCISCAPTQSLNILGCFHFWQDKGYEDAKPVIEALNSKGVSAIGAVGFCWGGRTSLSPHCYIILIDNYHNLLMLRLMYARNHIFNEKPIELSNPVFCFVLSYEWSLLIWYHDFFSAKVVVELGKSSAFIKKLLFCVILHSSLQMTSRVWISELNILMLCASRSYWFACYTLHFEVASNK